MFVLNIMVGLVRFLGFLSKGFSRMRKACLFCLGGPQTGLHHLGVIEVYPKFSDAAGSDLRGVSPTFGCSVLFSSACLKGSI